MSATLTARTFTRTARCGHTYEAPKPAGIRTLCDDCKAAAEAAEAAEKSARGTVRLGQMVRLDEGTIGQVWARSNVEGMWWIADGLLFREMTSVQVAEARVASVDDDVDALFAVEDEPTISVTIDTTAAVAAPAPAASPGIVVESYRLVAHDVSHTERDGHVVTACGDRYATDDATRSSEYRGASLVHPMGEGSAHESVCRRCVAAARVAAEREDVRRAPAAASDSRVARKLEMLASVQWAERVRELQHHDLSSDVVSQRISAAVRNAEAAMRRNDVGAALALLGGAERADRVLAAAETTVEQQPATSEPTYADDTLESAPSVETVGVFGDAEAAVRALLAPLGVHATPSGGRDSVLVLLAPGARPAAGYYRCRAPRVVVGTPAQYERHDGVWTWGAMRVPTLAERAERVGAERCVVLGDMADEAWLVERVRAAVGMPADCPPNG